jgi:hypothetical protein
VSYSFALTANYSANPTLFDPLLLLIATAADQQLVRYLEIPEVENRIPRAKMPMRLKATPQERQRLIKYSDCRDMPFLLSNQTVPHVAFRREPTAAAVRCNRTNGFHKPCLFPRREPSVSPVAPDTGRTMRPVG